MDQTILFCCLAALLAALGFRVGARDLSDAADNTNIFSDPLSNPSSDFREADKADLDNLTSPGPQIPAATSSLSDTDAATDISKEEPLTAEDIEGQKSVDSKPQPLSSDEGLGPAINTSAPSAPASDPSEALPETTKPEQEGLTATASSEGERRAAGEQPEPSAPKPKPRKSKLPDLQSGTPRESVTLPDTSTGTEPQSTNVNVSPEEMATNLLNAPFTTAPTRKFSTALHFLAAVDSAPPNAISEESLERVNKKRDLPDAAAEKCNLNVVIKYGGPQGPVEALSLIVPIWLPRIELTYSYVHVIMQLLEARQHDLSWETYAGTTTLFGQAHKVFTKVLGYICGQDGVLDRSRSNCAMTLREYDNGTMRALQLIIHDISISNDHGRPEQGNWLSYRHENFYSAAPRQVTGESVHTLFMRLKQNNPDRFKLCMRLLNWPDDKQQIENEHDAKKFLDTIQSREEGPQIGRKIVMENPEIPEAVRKVIVEAAEVEKHGMPMPMQGTEKMNWFQNLRSVEDEAGTFAGRSRGPPSEWAQPSAPPPEHMGYSQHQPAIFRLSSVSPTAPGEERAPSEDIEWRSPQTLPWNAFQQALAKRHGPYRRVPTWVEVTGMGAFLSSWQQLLETAMVETAMGPMAHATLIERLANLHKYFLFPFGDINEESKNEEEAYNSRRKAIKSVASSPQMKQCIALINAGGSVATHPAEGFRPTKQKARTLYGGIANTLGVPLTLASSVQEAFAAFIFVNLTSKGKRKQGKTQNQIIGVCAAMHVSSILYKCARGKEHELALNMFSSNIDGSKLAKHLMAAGASSLASHPTLVELCDPEKAVPLFTEVLQDILVTVSPVWEERSLFQSYVESSSKVTFVSATPRKRFFSSSSESESLFPQNTEGTDVPIPVVQEDFDEAGLNTKAGKESPLKSGSLKTDSISYKKGEGLYPQLNEL
ncbi:rhoptry neck protein RON4 [Cyclospora cayetanensis]|uniref:Rhoptry neck protein RON4 n=1 Tax=Cyclospora cayetanensis TaxID=88456 RepID=A0A1D3D2F5_9EIME|nr:rhoptry neck protein RON4 [Cyclospora cayetanensis]